MAAPNEVFIVLSFIGFLMCCIPLPWHLEAWNVGTCLYMLWTAAACLNQFVNSVVWNGNAVNRAPVWCDISARIIIGVAVAIPAASLCINRRLYSVSARTAPATKAEKRRSMAIDLSIGLGIPIVEMILQYIPQGHRFDIFEDVGCWPSVYNTPVAIALVAAPPVVIAGASAVYSVLCIRALSKSRAQFRQMLSYSHLTKDRYIRLMLLAGTETALTLPFSIYFLCMNVTHGPINPWLGWADTHFGFSRVDQIPAVIWHHNPYLVKSFDLSRSLVIICAFTFFAFFAFAEQARQHYSLVLRRIGVPRRFLSTSTPQASNVTGLRSRTTNTSFTSHTQNSSFEAQCGGQSKQDKLDFFDTESIGDIRGGLSEKKRLQISVSHVPYDDYASPENPFSPVPSTGISWTPVVATPPPTPMQPAVLRQEASWIDLSPIGRPSITNTQSVMKPAFDSSKSRYVPLKSSI